MLVAGCGDNAPPLAAPDATRTETSAGVPQTPRHAAAVISVAEIDSLIAAWRDADDDGRERATNALLDAGSPAVERLLVQIRADLHRIDSLEAERLILRFGPAAVRPLVALLSSDDDDTLGFACSHLERMAPDWVHGEDGELVCRALLARIAVPEDAEYVVPPLMACRPAGRSIARELADLWRTAPDDTRSRFGDILVALGPDAAPATPLVWEELAVAASQTGEQSDARRLDAMTILAAAGAADPSRLGLVVAALDSDSAAVRMQAVALLGAFGPAAASAKERLVRLLDDSEVGETAWHVLAALEPTDDATWIALVAHDPGEWVERLAETREGAARLAKRLDVIPGDDLYRVVNALEAGKTLDRRELAALLTRHPLAEGRAIAPWLWLDDDENAPPKEALALLDDADAGVRVAALRSFAATGAVTDAAILERGLEFAASTDEDVRRSALEVLGLIAAREPKALAVLVRALRDANERNHLYAVYALPDGASSDPDVRAALLDLLTEERSTLRGAALHCLASAALTSDDARKRVVGGLVEEVLDDTSSSDWTSPIEDLARIDGGLDALAAAIRPALNGAEKDHWKRRDALRIAAALAPRMPSLRSDLVHLRDNVEESDRSDVDEAIANVDFDAAKDAEAIARAPVSDYSKIERLLALGDAGRSALVLLAAATQRPHELLERLADVDLRAEILAAASAEGPDAAERRKGAAVLAPLLPDADALPMLTKLASDEAARAAVVRSLHALAERTPGIVPAPLVVRLLRRADGTRDWRALALVPRGGPAVAALDAAVVTDLAKYRDGDQPSARVRAAAMIFHLTGRQEEALPTFRAVLAKPERLTDDLPWDDVGDALARMRLTAEDIAGLLPALQRAASCCEPPEMNVEEPPDSGDWFQGVLTSIVPALEHCGPEAAAAVPALSMIVSKWGTWPEEGKAAIRVLGAIGPAARAAIPELRKAALQGDESGVVRDAIRRIEGAK